MLGARLKAARMSRGLSLRDLQAKIGNMATAQAIGKYENGNMSPADDKLKTLAEALGVTVDYLVSDSLVTLGAINFRENFLRSKKEESQVAATICHYLERYLEIEELLQVDTIDWRLPQGFPVLVKSEKDLDRAAKDLRDYWALGSDPIANFQELLEGKGVKVLLHALPSAVAGLTCFVNYKTAKIPVIVVNTEITGERQRFTLAHELGHLVLQEVETTKENEKNCDKFAGAFLMPDNFLFENLGRSRNSISIGELCSLKKNLGVSILAIAMRCKQTGIISSPLSRKLWGQFVSRGYTKHPYKEPDPLELLKKSERIKRLCFRGVTENIIDVEKASLLLKVTPDNIRLQMSHED